jgi:hypothetical protein
MITYRCCTARVSFVSIISCQMLFPWVNVFSTIYLFEHPDCINTNHVDLPIATQRQVKYLFLLHGNPYSLPPLFFEWAAASGLQKPTPILTTITRLPSDTRFVKCNAQFGANTISMLSTVYNPMSHKIRYMPRQPGRNEPFFLPRPATLSWHIHPSLWEEPTRPTEWMESVRPPSLSF